MAIDRYRVNDVLTALAAEVGVELDDDTLNELTHTVADALEAGPKTHFIECDQHPDNDQHYPCSCDKVLADLREHAEELAFDSMHEEG